MGQIFSGMRDLPKIFAGLRDLLQFFAGLRDWTPPSPPPMRVASYWPVSSMECPKMTNTYQDFTRFPISLALKTVITY